MMVFATVRRRALCRVPSCDIRNNILLVVLRFAIRGSFKLAPSSDSGLRFGVHLSASETTPRVAALRR
jgi:hypothetical protein